MSEIAKLKGYDIRDKRLADATETNSISNTDSIEMITDDNKQVYISKASFMTAIGKAFASSNPKTFTKLIGMNSNSPMGIGPSDLATVLFTLTTVCGVDQNRYPTRIADCLMDSKNIVCGTTNISSNNCPDSTNMNGCIVIIPIWWGSATASGGALRIWWSKDALWVHLTTWLGNSGWRQLF